MSKQIEQLYQKYHQVMEDLNIDGTQVKAELIDYHISKVKELDILETGAITLYNLYEKRHIYVSPRMGKLFGYDLEKAKVIGNDYFDLKTHPDDLVYMLKAGTYFLNLFNSLEGLPEKSFKFVSEYRILRKTGEYIQIVEQQTGLEFDDQGKPWLALGVMDFSPNPEMNKKASARVINQNTGEFYYFPEETEISPKNSARELSPREKEVLQMLAGGLMSKQIADQLFISVNTVNTHRQRIIEKLNVSNTAQAIRYGVSVGILPPTLSV